MKQQIKQSVQSGFTLIELIIVIAIISMIAVVGVRAYGNLKTIQAKKMNAANIKRIACALTEYNEIRSSVAGRFGYFDSLIDMKCDSLANANLTAEEGDASQVDAGKAGTFDFTSTMKPTEQSSIIYNGAWKLLGSYDSEEAKATREGTSANNGIPDGLANMVGIYYLSESDAKLVREAGITTVLVHNHTTGTPLCKDQRGGGGPGFRPDMSAFGPVTVSNGTPVIVFRPDAASVWAGPKPIGNMLYEDFGITLTNRTDLLNACHPSTSPVYPLPTAFENLLKTKKLIAFGIGRGAECVVSNVGLGEALVNPMYERSYYRQYLAVFALTSGNGKTGGTSKCEFVGVVDCAGLTQNGANYVANWQSDGE